MSTDATAFETPAVETPALRNAGALADYWALTKPDVNLLILITTFAGFCLARPSHWHGFPIFLLLHTLFGTSLVAAGTGALNQFVERRFDAQMRRTRRRPIVAGRINPSHALWFGLLASAFGVLYLSTMTNLLAGSLAAATAISYLAVYTPAKRTTPWCTLAGAFSGAAPPLIGWAAASEQLPPRAWILYGIVFLWQFPHFMAIAWMYRHDYERAGYLVLPQGEKRNQFLAFQAILPTLGPLVIPLLPKLSGNAGWTFAVGAEVLALWLSYYAAQLVLRRTNVNASRLLLASILYLPIVFALMVLDRT
jgi:protoheme IX farnesyltransferase